MEPRFRIIRTGEGWECSDPINPPMAWVMCAAWGSEGGMKGPLGCISHAILEGLAELVREPRPHIPLALSPCERSGVGSGGL